LDPSPPAVKEDKEWSEGRGARRKGESEERRGERER
jgi:hypothetical protein